MKLVKVGTLVLLMIFMSGAKAQNFELGKVSIEELQEKAHPKDTAAVAAFLFTKGKTSYEYNKTNGFIMLTNVKARIKIYKKEGFEWANKKVRYYLGNDAKETITFTDAVTYNLVGSIIERTKLKSEGQFNEVVNRYWGQQKISMPNVKVGSVIEYEYTIRTPYISSPKDWNFQTSIPVNYSEYKTFVPEYLVLSTNNKGYIFPAISVEKQAKTIKSLEMETRGAAISSSNVNASFSESILRYEETRTTYVLEHLPAMNEEAYVNNIDNYSASLVQELSMTKFPNRPLKPYSTDWNAVVKTIYGNDDFGLELDKKGYFENDINALIANLKTPEEKIEAIFNLVKSTVKWNNYYGYSCNDGVKKAYNSKTGNVAEINLILTAMLRYAGLSANPVLVSTRTNGVAIFPSRTAFDYVISAVSVGNGLVLLDATDKFSSPDVLPLRDLNWNGRLIRKDGTSDDVDLMPKVHAKESVFMMYAFNESGKIEGKIKKQLANHEALIFRDKNILTTEDAYLEQLENENNSIEVESYKRENDLDLSKPIVESYSFKDTNDFERINNKIYLSPMLFLATKENPFKQDARKYPIDFGYPMQNKYNINIEIPKGYSVESIPEAMNIAMADNMGSFKYMIGSSGNSLQLVISSDINTAIISAEYYQMLKDFFQKMIDKQNEKIVLIKV